MRIGYAKIGRNMPLQESSWGFVGGDDEPPLVLRTLALRNPEHEFVILGRNSGERPQDIGMPDNVTNPWVEWRPSLAADIKGKTNPEIVLIQDAYTLESWRGVDGLIVWTGQHGTSNTPIPTVGHGWDEELTKPQDSFVRYAGYVVRGINAFRAADPLNREEIWLCPDARNYIKARDLKWPLRHPVLGQFDWSRMEKHERYGDPRSPEECGFEAKPLDGHVWHARQHYCYSRLEVCGVTPQHMNTELGPFEGRQHFGLFINEARSYVRLNRFEITRDWVLPLQPAFIHGKWPEDKQAKLGVQITSIPFSEYYDRLRSVACTFTTPTSGTGWATTKPWQAFGTGTVCFFHPAYDTQGHIIPTTAQVLAGQVDHNRSLKALATWLRVETPEELASRVWQVAQDRDIWHYLATAQRALYDQACEELAYARHIEERLGIV